MYLKPLYSVRFHYPEDWAVELTGPAGKEEHHFFFAEGVCTGRWRAGFEARTIPDAAPTSRSRRTSRA